MNYAIVIMSIKCDAKLYKYDVNCVIKVKKKQQQNYTVMIQNVWVEGRNISCN